MNLERLWKKRTWTTREWLMWAKSVSPIEAIESVALAIETIYKKLLDQEDRLTELEKRRK